MYEFQGQEKGFNEMFGLKFKVRKAFKGFLGFVAVLLGLLVLAIALPALYRLATRRENTKIIGLVPFYESDIRELSGVLTRLSLFKGKSALFSPFWLKGLPHICFSTLRSEGVAARVG